MRVGRPFEDAELAETLVTLFDEAFDRDFRQFAQLRPQILLHSQPRQATVAVRAADRLFDHVVDDAEFEEVFRRKFERFGRFVLMFAAFPKDARAPLRTDDAVIREFQHRDAVADGDPDRAAASAFADDDRDNRRRQGRHLEHRFRDRLGDAAFLRRDAGIGARSVDETNNRKAEFRRHPHLRDRLAVPLRVRATEVALNAFFSVASLLVSDHHRFEFVEFRPTDANRSVVAERFVAVQLDELVEHEVDVIERLRTLRVPRDFDRFPSVEVRVNFFRQFGQSESQTLNFFANFRRIVGFFAQRFEARFHLKNRLFERKALCGGRHIAVLRKTKIRGNIERSKNAVCGAPRRADGRVARRPLNGVKSVI